jgi:argininosuccinate lyase
MTSLWGGRFSGKLDKAAFDLNASLPFDQRMAIQDVKGSVAWADALSRAEVLTEDESSRIISGLEAVEAEFESGSFAFADSDEDIHTAVERRLGELIGPLAGKLHTGRSRNDQVATDFRLWMLEVLPELDAAIAGLQSTLVMLAEKHHSTLMPGYTHLQRAQPITLGHWLLSHFWALNRDRERLSDLRDRVTVLPLGCGALAGTAFPIDRNALAESLGFDAPAPNSLDAVSDRDFAAEYLFCAATGSSLMPQKKNPDMFELARGKAGMLIGLLTGLLSTLKGLPSTYDKDLQGDKVPIFQATDTLLAILPVLAGALDTMTVNEKRMAAAIDASMLATDLADYLVRKGVPFREAHWISGKAVRAAAEKGVSLDELSLNDWQAIGPFDADVKDVFDPMKSVEARNAIGGTSPQSVKKQIQKAKLALTPSPSP